MAVLEIAIDIGTCYTSIFVAGNGIVLREPTVIAFYGDQRNRKIRAVGRQAYEMVGKAPDKTTIVSPVVDGFIVNFEACALLLREFIKKILPSNYILFPKIKAILGVPTGLTVEERKAYEDVVLGAFVKEVTMVENIILSAVGIDLPITTTFGGLIASIGGGVTEVASMSLSGVISGGSMSVGGNHMDNALIDYVLGKHNLKIGLNSARKLKKEIGSLYERDTSEITVIGMDMTTKSTNSVKIRSHEIFQTLRRYYAHASNTVESIINTLPPEIAADIHRTGVHFVGGASAITGLDRFMSDRLHLSITIPYSPEYSAILGAGKLLSDRALLREILAQK